MRGPIPRGMILCHRCDESRCCNPDHLFLGTRGDNMADHPIFQTVRDTRRLYIPEPFLAPAGKRPVA